MRMSKRRSVAYLLLIAAALILAYCLRFLFYPMTDNALLAIGFMTLRWAIQVTLTILWVASIRRRILNTAIRRMLLTVGGLLLFWQLVRIIKYDYVIVTDAIGRYCWYSYYIPMVLVPLIGVFVVNHIGKPEGYHSPGWMKYLFIPAFSLIATVLTNDLHQLVFTFHNGFKLYNRDYGYGFMYIVVMAWFVVLALFFAIGLLLKSRVPGSRNFQHLPQFITLFAILFWTGSTLKLYTGDLTAVDCIFIIMLLEGAIQSGLIPSNMNYRELFRKSTIAAQIADMQHQILYSSANAVPLEYAIMEQAKNAAVDLDDTGLHAQPISGGHIFWQDDMKAINELTEHLRETNETLSERYALMKAEVEIKENRLHAEEKSRLYDRIAREISGQLDKAEELLHQSRKHPDQAKEYLAQVCVISAYIKRRANLILLGEENAMISAQELESCLRESLDNLRLCGVITYLDCRCEGQADIGQIIAIYDLFEYVTENILGQLSAMMVTAVCKDRSMRIRIQCGCREKIQTIPALSLPGGNVSCEILDEDLLVEASLVHGGGQL